MLVILKQQEGLPIQKTSKQANKQIKNTVPPVTATKILYYNFVSLDSKLLKYKYVPRSNSTFRHHQLFITL